MKTGNACFNGNHDNCSYTGCGCVCHATGTDVGTSKIGHTDIFPHTNYKEQLLSKCSDPKEQKKLTCRCGKGGAQCMVHNPPFPINICGILIHASAGQYCAKPMPCRTHTIEKGFTPSYEQFKKEMENKHQTSNITITHTESTPKCDMCMEMSKKAGSKVFCLEHLPSPTKPEQDHSNCTYKCKWNFAWCPGSFSQKPDTEEWEKTFYKLTDTMDGQFRPDLLKLFRQEKEKSYQAGLHKGYEEEAVGCFEHCEEARHSAYSEIMEMVEEQLEAVNEFKSEEDLSSYYRGAKIALNKIKFKLKSKLTQK